MIDPAASESSLSASPRAVTDAMEAFGRVLTEEAAPLRDQAMLLISGLLTSEEGVPGTSGDGRVFIKVSSRTRSIRVEIRDAGTGIVLGGLRQQRGPASRWSPHLLSKIADRWGVVHGSGSNSISRHSAPGRDPEMRPRPRAVEPDRAHPTLG
jgi:hypothetical protein